MKFLFFNLIYCIFVFTNCIQKQNEFEDRQVILAGLVSQGSPKSFGLDLLINNRINRGCETRIGNLVADSIAWKGNATLGFFGAGSIRDNSGIKSAYPNGIIPKGTVPTVDLLKRVLAFQGGEVARINIQTYRIKQMLEHSVGRLNNQAERNTDNVDVDGPMHGNCWLEPNVSGSGRFLQVSSKILIEVNPTATASIVSGNPALQDLRVTTEGNRITQIIIDGLLIYKNPSGSINSGWTKGNSSCTIKGTTFPSSSACNYYTVGVEKFQFDGGDSNPVMNPNMLEINNDGSVTVQETGIGGKLSDAEILYEYIQTFTTGPVFPKVSNRILMP